MNNLLNKIKLFYLKIIKIKESYKRHGIKPARDWFILISIVFAIFCILAVFAVYLYIQIQNDELFTVAEPKDLKEVKIDIFHLEKTVKDINYRNELNANAKNNEVKFPDPSL